MWPNGASECERSECPTSGPEGARSAGWLLGEVIRTRSQGQLMSVVKDQAPAATCFRDIADVVDSSSSKKPMRLSGAIPYSSARKRAGIARVLAPVSLISAFSLPGRIHGLSQGHPS